jgi:hypothetical protein
MGDLWKRRISVMISASVNQGVRVGLLIFTPDSSALFTSSTFINLQKSSIKQNISVISIFMAIIPALKNSESLAFLFLHI